ncbi:hypothetical protein FE391_14300 [Nonomuraea sp. KC401]|uniref:Uncharacterized protein n=1 Tax=Nonomuraea diastatica TaxID=1848329 RepID=A0A4R4WJP7_9ACTN|nr:MULTISPECIES: hypothetical protein [Nonomuraea]NBE94020.1 hypothetical protein [Nonomuraea sp. K271]TDD19252.1 hypothetical protein E1294_21625 [Nonomuraea diastatica]TLF74572.1 hypothetical protein FE391_14300 [Nonomuraea sp. KC401]
MMRRILAGAAIAGFMLGFSATSASADVPNPYNKGKQILSQLSLADDLTLLNDVGNDSVKYIDVLTAGHLQDIDLSLLSNQENVGDDN